MVKNKYLIIAYASSIVALLLIFLWFQTKTAHAFDIVSSPTASQSLLWAQGLYVASGDMLFSAYRPKITYNGTTVLYWPDLGFQSNLQDRLKITPLTSNIDLVELFLQYYEPSAKYTVKLIFNKSTLHATQIWYISTPCFIGGGIVSCISGSNINQYYVTDFTGSTFPTPIQTIPKPDSWFATTGYQMPVYYSFGSGHAFLYQGTDGKAYRVIDTFQAGGSIIASSSETWTIVPLGNLIANDAIFARQTTGSGSKFYPNLALWASGSTLELSTNYTLDTLTTFQNPVAYFRESGGSIVKWDMNCQTPGYDSCRLSSGVFKCTDWSGALSPGGETCGGTVTAPSAPSCHDGIQNQDEIGIDYGGVCNNLRSTGCFPKTYNLFSSNPYAFQTLTGGTTAVSNSGEISYDNYSSDSLDEDFFGFFNPKSGSVVYTGSLSVTSGWPMSVIKPRPDDNLASAEIFAMRGGEYRKINYVRFHTNYQGISVIGAQLSNYVADVTFKNKNGSVTVPMTWSGWYATAQTSSYADKDMIIDNLSSSIAFDGLEVGYSTGTVTKTNCGNQYYSCSFVQTWPSTFSCQSSLNPSGTPQGTCQVSGVNCEPTSNTSGYYDGFTASGSSLIPITNGSGTVTGVALSGTDDIFSCSIRDGFQAIGDSIMCPITVLGKVWGKMKEGISQTLDFISNVVGIGSDSFTGSVIPDNSGYTDIGNASGTTLNPLVSSLYTASDRLRAQNDGIGGLVKTSTYGIYFLGFMFILFLIIGAWAWKNWSK